ncbi:hypothetical protein MRX96_029007 [Rhipicephalus microplus]
MRASMEIVIKTTKMALPAQTVTLGENLQPDGTPAGGPLSRGSELWRLSSSSPAAADSEPPSRCCFLWNSGLLGVWRSSFQKGSSVLQRSYRAAMFSGRFVQHDGFDQFFGPRQPAIHFGNVPCFFIFLL